MRYEFDYAYFASSDDGNAMSTSDRVRDAVALLQSADDYVIIKEDGKECRSALDVQTAIERVRQRLQSTSTPLPKQKTKKGFWTKQNIILACLSAVLLIASIVMYIITSDSYEVAAYLIEKYNLS